MHIIPTIIKDLQNRYLATFICAIALGLSFSAPCTYAADSNGTLNISQGGVYSGGTYSNAVIKYSGPDSIVISNINFVGPGVIVSTRTRPNVTITNCTFSSSAPDHAVELWNVASFTFEHNTLNGTGGVVIMDPKPAKVHVRYNLFNNISGATGPTTRRKTSAIQLDSIHCADIEIAYNAVVNKRGQSAIEDSISLMESGGAAQQPALIHDNLVDGAFNWPVGGILYSGTGIMCYDPAGSDGSDEGGYTHCYSNTILAVEGVGIDCAGSHDIEIDNNTLVNDGSTTSAANYGLRTFNWENKTPISCFGPFQVHDNQSHWMQGTKKLNYSFSTSQTTTSHNTIVDTLKESDARQAWWARIAANGITVGNSGTASRGGATTPAQQTSTAATSLFDAMKYTDASETVKLVPLPKENLGDPTSVGYIYNGSWIRYSGIDFGSGVSSFTVTLSEPKPDRFIHLHLDSVTGPLVGVVSIPVTGGWYVYQPTTISVSGASGVHDLVLVFTDSVNVQSFQFK